MTDKKQLKTRVRARMARTGESYVTALRNMTAISAATPAGGNAGTHSDARSDAELAVDRGYTLRGGLHPESANIAHLLAHHSIGVAGSDANTGVGPVSEALVFGIGGGPGAGYILWEFKRHDSAILVLGFHNSWQYPDRWHQKTLERLGVRYQAEHTGGAGSAARRLTEHLQAGRPCIIRPDRYHLGYWHMPEFQDGHGGPDIVVYAEDEHGVHVDDRNLSPLVVSRQRIDAARARVGSYKNSLYTIDPESGPISAATLREAVRAGLDDCVQHLNAPSDSFSLPAWRKWSRLMVDSKNAKGWPRVFEGGRTLAGVLLSVWEGVTPAGGWGGHLRDLYADFLDEAAVLLENPKLAGAAGSFRTTAAAWHAVADAALPDDVTDLARLRDLSVALRLTIVDPASSSPEEAGEAAAELWQRRAALNAGFPLDSAGTRDLLESLSAAVDRVYTLEVAAVSQLEAALA